MNLKTAKTFTCHKVVEIPITQEVVARVNQLGAADGIPTKLTVEYHCNDKRANIDPVMTSDGVFKWPGKSSSGSFLVANLHSPP